MQKTIPDYDSLKGVLDRLESDITPAEIHGTLCGLLCARSGAPARLWQDNFWPELDKGDLLAREVRAVLNELHEITRDQLNDPTCDFQLLMPGDEEELDTRIHALSEWCQGFLAGLALGGVRDFNHLPEDVREIANDLVEIARAETSYDLEGNEEDEEAYTELMEYLRVGVLLINEELQPLQGTSPSNTTMH